jgi:hypothetical protein
MAVTPAGLSAIIDHVDKFNKVGVRVKVGGDWITRKRSRPDVVVEGLKHCRLDEARNILRDEIGLNAQEVISRESGRGGTMSVAAIGVPQCDIDALRGRVLFNLRNGALARVFVSTPFDTDRLLHSGKRTWGVQRQSSWK